MKGKLKVKELISIIISAFIVLAVISGCYFTKSKNDLKKLNISAENQRAMEYEQYKDGDENVEQTENVKFNAFFLRDLDSDGNADTLYGTCKKIGDLDTLYMELIVQTGGHLTNAKIEINGRNFYLQTALPKDQQLANSYIGNNTTEIEFNDLQNGTQKLITGMVKSGDYSYDSKKYTAIGYNVKNYSRNDNTVVLTGTYISDDETIQTEIRKEVKLTVDWYGTTQAKLYTGKGFLAGNQNNQDLDSRIDIENGKIKLDFEINTEETNKELNIYSNIVNGTIPKLNGYDPLEVKLTKGTGTFNYNSNTRKFEIQKYSDYNSYSGELRTIISNRNSYTIEVIYPLEAYETSGEDSITLKIPVQTYYEGYNNWNDEFENYYKSNTAGDTIVAIYKKKQGRVAKIDIEVGKYVRTPYYHYMVSKQKPLNIYYNKSSEEKDDKYIVKWRAYTGSSETNTGFILKETKDGESQKNDVFIKTDSTEDSMDDVTSNIGIFFSGADYALKEDGWIKVYNVETDELIETFDKSNWSRYNENNPYKYEYPVKHIRIETSQTNKEASLYIYNVKELDDSAITTRYSKERFDELEYIKSNLAGYLNGNLIDAISHRAYYDAPHSIANISLSKDAISTQLTENNFIFKINTIYRQDENINKWKNGIFLIKLPDEILFTEINKIETNNTNVNIKSYEYIENEKGKFIKIYTENIKAQEYEIIVDTNITADPRIATVSREVELYAYNDEIGEYYYRTEDNYDINDNLNVNEIITKKEVTLNLIAPNSLITNQMASDFDEQGTVIISPQIAELKPSNEESQNKETVKIGVDIKNNYSNTISDIKVIGKIPFEGNTYVLSGGNLNSQFTTTMKDTGMEVPQELQDKVVIYYSENENPTKELTDTNNGWVTKENVTDWSKVKTFLIDFGNNKIEQGKNYTFYYIVEIPYGVNYNDIAYSHHGIYFSLDTQQGKYRTQTEPNRLGIRIAEKYNLEFIKYQKNKEKVLQGALYRVSKLNGEGEIVETKTEKTDENGILKMLNLYVENTYEIEELKAPSGYEINEEIIKIIGHVDRTSGELTIEKLQGTTKEDIQITKNENENYKITVKLEDEVKANLNITKVEKDTNIEIPNVVYNITGGSLDENGQYLKTNNNGQIIARDIEIGKEYTLKEITANGYYIENQIRFKITNNNGTYNVEIKEGTVKENTITEENGIPSLNIVLEDEKIPTYSLNITKIEKGNAENFIEGVKFKLYKDDKEIGQYITDNNGKITISNLYQFVEGKSETGVYKLKEVYAPEGYAKVKDITFRVQEKNGALIFESEQTNNYSAEGNTIKLTIEDSPSFKLIKKDGETNALLPNVKFAIYNVDNGETPARNSKGEIIGTREIINGEEYYTVKTNERGEVTVDLPEGLYKAVEVEAEEKYDIEDKTEYFGIGASREPKKTPKIQWGRAFGTDKDETVETIVSTEDGGYIVGGYTKSSILDLENNVVLTLNNYNNDKKGVIIKYNDEGVAQWAKNVGNSIKSIIKTKDDSFLVIGNSDYYTYLENDLTINRGSFIIKYNAEGEAQWAKNIGTSIYDSINTINYTKDEGFIIGGKIDSASIDFGNNVVIYKDSNSSRDGFIAKYNKEGVVQWAKTIVGFDALNSVIETIDNGYLVGGNYSSSSIDLGNDIVLDKQSGIDGIIIKYNSEGTVQWAKNIEGTDLEYVNKITQTTKGDYIVVGKCITSKDFVGYGMLIKYNSEGIVQWTNRLGISPTEFKSVFEDSNGNIVVCGKTGGTSWIDSNKLFNSSQSSGGLIAKFEDNGSLKWASVLGSYINSATQTKEGEYLIGGYFSGKQLELNTELDKMENIYNSGSYDGFIIKIDEIETKDVVVKSYKTDSTGPNAIIKTKDGGYISSTTESTGSYYNAKYKCSIKKYDKNWNIEWEKIIERSGSISFSSILEREDGFILVGSFSGRTLELENNIRLENHCISIYPEKDSDAIIIKLDYNGNIDWAKNYGSNRDYNYSTEYNSGNSDTINKIINTSDGGFIGGMRTINATELDLRSDVDRWLNKENGLIFRQLKGYTLTLIKFNKFGDIEWAKLINTNSGVMSITDICLTSNGEILAIGYFNERTFTIENEVFENTDYSSSTSNANSFFVKYSSTGDLIFAKHIEGKSAYLNSVIETKQGEYIIGGYKYRDNYSQYSSINQYSGILQKYDSEGNLIWNRDLITRRIYDVISTKDGGYALKYDAEIIKYNQKDEIEWYDKLGKFSSNNNLFIEDNKGNYLLIAYLSNGNYVDLENGKKIGYSYNNKYVFLEVAAEMGVPEEQEITFENNIKEFKVTTDIIEIDGMKGGSISGEDESPYETVRFGDSSTKTIKMEPNEKYEIFEVTVNGKEYNFSVNEDGTYTMPQFENMKEDKHIVVKYISKDHKFTLNKIDKQTGDKLKGAKFKIEQIEEREQPDSSAIIGVLTNNGEYYFVEKDGKYIPTNEAKYKNANNITDSTGNTVARSYIPINLTENTGKYTLTVNAEIAVGSRNYGYATITEGTTSPNYDDTDGRFIYITENIEAKDYSIVLQGGKMYYLHLGYFKYNSSSGENDSFDINSVNITLNNSDLYNVELETNAEGKAITQLPFGKYNITEIEAPDSYELIKTPIQIEFRENGEKEFTVENSKQGKVIVHHYLKNRDGVYTTTKLAEDEVLQDNIGDEYTTKANLNIIGYTLEKDDNDEYVLPENYTGVYTNSVIEVNYYYEEAKIPLTVHHYIEGTNTRVQLANGQLANDEYGSGYKGENYTTSPISENDLNSGYELSEIPYNKEGEYTGSEIIVTYYYKQVRRNVTITKYDPTGTIKLQGAKFNVLYSSNNRKYGEYTTDADGKIEIDLPVGSYKIVETQAPEGYQLDTTEQLIVISKDSQQQEININNEKKKGTVTVHYYIEGTTTPVKLADGNDAESVTKQGTIGENYVTKPVENVLEYYEVVSEEPENASGEYIDGNIEVIYYYKLKQYSYRTEYYYDGVFDNSKTENHPATYGETIENYIDKIEDGYKFQKTEGLPLTISTDISKNIIKVYYIRRTDLSYTVNYLEKGTNEVLKEPKVTGNKQYNDIVKAIDEIEPIAKYNYDSTDKEELTIKTNEEENVINLYYTKKDAKATVKYVDEKTNEEISTQDIITGKIDDEYTTSPKTIENYELTRNSGNTSGKLTEQEITVIYYYVQKSAGVVINHIDINTNNKLAETETISGKIDDEYTTSEKEIEGYDLVREQYPSNANGKMTKDLITVNYYYTKKTKVIVKYIDKNTGEELIDQIVIDGHEKDNYETEAKEIPTYILTGEPENKTGIMTAEPIEVIYYYEQTPAGVTEKHIDEYTGELLDSKTYQGYEGNDYTTSPKEFEGYELDSTKLPTNATGKMTKDPIEVKYYYRYKTSVTAKYVDKVTGQEIVPSTSINGYEGDDYKTEKKEYNEEKEETIPFKDYVLVEEPENKEGKMTKEPITVIYYYIHNSAGVRVNHYDVITGQKLVEEEKIEGHEGDNYKTEEKEIERYDLVREKYPENAEGKMKIEETKVDYYYIRRSGITVKYIDKASGRELTEQIVIEGHEGDSYETEDKKFENYALEKVPEDAKGKMEAEPKTIIYYYLHKSAGVKVNYYDIETGEKIAEEELIIGHEGDDYTTEELKIKGYEIVKERYPENAKGKMTIEEIKVDYYYTQESHVVVKYVDKITGKEISERDTITGKEGDPYTTEEKKIENYDIEKELYPSNKEGTITKEDIEVIYYYIRNTEVTVKYVDKETGKEIEEKEIIKGHEGEEYKTNKKDIKNYILIEEPKNKEGKMTPEPIEAIYYYRQAIFNLSIEKQVKEIQVDGETKKVNKDIAKVEVKRKKIKDTEVKVVYTIKVTNDGELEGNAIIEENIPEGMIMEEEYNKEWNIKGTKATIKTKEIKPGESVEYTVVLTWENSNENFGTKENIVRLTDTTNVAGFKEKNTDDNTDDAQFMITVSTGAKTAVRAAGITTIVLSAIGVCIVVIKRKTKE